VKRLVDDRGFWNGKSRSTGTLNPLARVGVCAWQPRNAAAMNVGARKGDSHVRGTKATSHRIAQERETGDPKRMSVLPEVARLTAES
jgi:hypothetical protein